MGLKRKIESKKPKKAPLKIVSREEWEAQPIKGRVVHLKHPVEYIRYGYTGTFQCKVINKCMPILKEYQQSFIDNNFPDQPYNFLIGGDGVVYEGRGWNLEADRPEKIHRKIKGNAIDIGYIGDFSDDAVPEKMVGAAEELVEIALEEGFLRACPKTLTLNDYQPIVFK